MKRIIVTLFTLVLSTSVFGEETVKQSAATPVLPFTETKGQPDYEPESFEFSALGQRYKLSADGRGQTIDRASRRFNLRIPRRDGLRHAIYHAEYEGDLLLICESGDEESAAGFITRLDGRTLRLKWKRPIPAFNVGPGLIEERHAYVTALGFIAKVDLRSGAVVWKHSNLYRNNHFNAFELPRVEDDTVIFKEVTTYPDQTRKITVNKRSGKLISMK